MKLLIDGQESVWQFSPDRTLGDVISDINGRLVADIRRVIADISVDGTGDYVEGDALSVEVGKIEEMRLQTQPLKDHLIALADDGVTRLDAVKQLIGEIIEGVMGGRMDIAGLKLGQTAENLLIVFDMIYLMGQIGVVDMETLKCGDGTFPEFRTRFNTILNDINSSLENRDTTLIKDFLEYEFEPAVGDLRMALPEIRDKVSQLSFE